jgi:hypothetical protein
MNISKKLYQKEIARVFSFLSILMLSLFVLGGSQTYAGPIDRDTGLTDSGSSGVQKLTARVKDNCQKRYPMPKIRFSHKDKDGRIYIPVVNWNAYDNEMFRKAPELPPCGKNNNSSRTWVDIYDAKTHKRIYGFCAFDSNDDLKKIWFMPKARSGRVYIILIDRACKRRYRSNIVAYGIARPRNECQKRYPNPRIRFDHKDRTGRVYIPVVNWANYDNVLFRKAPELPPCGKNTNSSRTWVDIYDALTNKRIYGFCAFNSKDDLKKIWFLPKARKGRVYIILLDRACRRRYRSNTISY